MIELTKETPDIETASDAYAQRFTGEAGRYLLSEQEAAVRAVLVLGSARVNLASGQRKTVSVRVNGGAAGIAERGRLPARIRVSSSDASGNSVARSRAVSLRIPRR